jgi:hypothetical protein
LCFDVNVLVEIIVSGLSYWLPGDNSFLFDGIILCVGLGAGDIVTFTVDFWRDKTQSRLVLSINVWQDKLICTVIAICMAISDFPVLRHGGKGN